MKKWITRQPKRTEEEKQRFKEEERLRREQMSGYADVPADADFDEFTDREVDE